MSLSFIVPPCHRVVIAASFLVARPCSTRDSLETSDCEGRRTISLRWTRKGNNEEGVNVLTMTRDAAEAVRAIAAASPEVPDDSGLRIRRREQEGAEAGLELTMVENPEVDDQVIEEAGARVFVDADLAPALDDKVLDAAIVEDRVQFTLTEQA